jgi:hypothetical protein
LTKAIQHNKLAIDWPGKSFGREDSGGGGGGSGGTEPGRLDWPLAMPDGSGGDNNATRLT